MEEQRKIVEGADALLNLAGITTYNTRKRSLSISDEQHQQQILIQHQQQQQQQHHHHHHHNQPQEQRELQQQQQRQQPLYRPRLLRKEKITKVNCKESINISHSASEDYTCNEVTNYYNISKNNFNGNSSNGNCSSSSTSSSEGLMLNDKSKLQNSKMAAVSNGRRPRKKLDKKRIKI